MSRRKESSRQLKKSIRAFELALEALLAMSEEVAPARTQRAALSRCPRTDRSVARRTRMAGLPALGGVAAADAPRPSRFSVNPKLAAPRRELGSVR
jgi:hypothetical protein